MSLMFCNIRSLRYHADIINRERGFNNCDLLFFVETRLHSAVNNNNNILNNFESIFNTWGERKTVHGQICFKNKRLEPIRTIEIEPLRDNSLNGLYEQSCKLELSAFKYYFDNVKGKKRKFYFVFIYNHPGNSNVQFYNELYQFLNVIGKDKPFILIGDFNIYFNN